MKKNAGITLVALVITIIILLILAGVAISMITGGEGLFAQANDAATKYNQAAKNEAEWLNKILEGDWSYVPEELTNGSFSPDDGHNLPDTSKLPTETTYYVIWNKIGPTYEEYFTKTPTEHWYDYKNGQWANIKTTSVDENLEAYWVWIPRFAYKLPESSTAQEIEVAFVKNNSKTVVQADGAEVEGYYTTDVEITADKSGLYTSKTADAADKWIIHPAFAFGDKQLNGIWFAKYEASSSKPSAENGGGNVTNLKVQVKPGVTNWRAIELANSFTVCRTMQDTGGAVGTETGNIEIDTHMTKNMEWAAVIILSQSKYGIFNSQSATGENGDKTYKIWNNPNNQYITGRVAATAGADAKNLSETACLPYNSTIGTKGSTTGTVYGVYDMAGGGWDSVMGIMENSAGSSIPSNANTGFTTWPDRKYYEIYAYGTSDTEYNRGKIGDLTRELIPASGRTWNDDYAFTMLSSEALFSRGGWQNDGTHAGAFAFSRYTGIYDTRAFRPVLIHV